MHAQRPKGQWFACLVVDEEHLRVQDHAVAPRESLGDVVLKVGHLEAEDSRMREKQAAGPEATPQKAKPRPQQGHRTPTHGSPAPRQHRPRPCQPPGQRKGVVSEPCPDPAGGGLMPSPFLWATEEETTRGRPTGREVAKRSGEEG